MCRHLCGKIFGRLLDYVPDEFTSCAIRTRSRIIGRIFFQWRTSDAVSFTTAARGNGNVQTASARALLFEMHVHCLHVEPALHALKTTRLVHKVPYALAGSMACEYGAATRRQRLALVWTHAGPSFARSGATLGGVGCATLEDNGCAELSARLPAGHVSELVWGYPPRGCGARRRTPLRGGRLGV